MPQPLSEAERENISHRLNEGTYTLDPGADPDETIDGTSALFPTIDGHLLSFCVVPGMGSNVFLQALCWTDDTNPPTHYYYVINTDGTYQKYSRQEGVYGGPGTTELLADGTWTMA